MNKQNGFTLGELSIVMVVIGFLSLFTLFGASKLVPDKNRVLYKKAYNITQKIVYELVNDESIYPYKADGNVLDDTTEITDPATGTLVNNANRLAKFQELFYNRLNVVDSTNHITSDGVRWNITEASGSGYCFSITIITNTNTTANVSGDNQNQFNLIVLCNGVVRPNPGRADSNEIKYLKESMIRKTN